MGAGRGQADHGELSEEVAPELALRGCIEECGHGKMTERERMRKKA